MISPPLSLRYHTDQGRVARQYWPASDEDALPQLDVVRLRQVPSSIAPVKRSRAFRRQAGANCVPCPLLKQVLEIILRDGGMMSDIRIPKPPVLGAVAAKSRCVAGMDPVGLSPSVGMSIDSMMRCGCGGSS
jgi:hypothetical protein